MHNPILDLKLSKIIPATNVALLNHGRIMSSFAVEYYNNLTVFILSPTIEVNMLAAHKPSFIWQSGDAYLLYEDNITVLFRCNSVSF